ncbi:MAG TPA: hypothetical protein VKB52_12360 [Rhodanobacteraceae bacterium]|nr:hypothetical protein [Rhodanobacteraceae bacterium]
MNEPSGTTRDPRDAGPGAARLWAAAALFGDSELSLAQIGTEIDALSADFARCLAMSAWAAVKPLRMVVFGLSMRTTLDDCLLALLRAERHAVGGLDDELLRPCWESRWEFVAGTAKTPSLYRQAPSYNERLRVALLADAWERTSYKLSDVDAFVMTSDRLARASAALSPKLELPMSLLLDAATERRRDVEAFEHLRTHLRKLVVEFAMDDLRRLALFEALDGKANLPDTVRRFGTPAMRVLLRAHLDRTPATHAREMLTTLLGDLREVLWGPLGIS